MTATTTSNLPGTERNSRPEAFGHAFIIAITNLWWLFRLVAAAAPRSVRRWLLLVLVGGIAVPVQLWATKGVADNLQERLTGGAGEAMWWFAALWVGLASFSMLAEQAEGTLAATARERGGSTIAAAVLDQATRVDLASFEQQDFYDKTSLVLTSAEGQATSVLEQIMRTIWALPRVTTSAVVLFAFDWRLALIAILPLIPANWIWFASGTTYWNVFQQQTRERRLAASYARLLTSREGAKEVRVFGLAPTLIARWEDSFLQAAKDLRRRGFQIGLRQRGANLGSLTVMLLGLAWFVSVAPTGASAGTIVIVVGSFFTLYGNVINLAQPVQQLGQAAGFARDLRGFLTRPTETGPLAALPAITRPRGELRLDHVTFAYPGAETPTLADISLTVPAGTTIALVGENGAGKTTLVKLMLGLYQPDAGQVLLDGTDLVMHAPAAVRQHFSGVFQHFVRYPVSAHDNVTLGNHLPDDQVERALGLAGLPHLAERLPDGLATVLAPDLGGTDLPGGQWQRIAIARAGVRDACLLALDEPTAALDPLAEVAIFRQFSTLAQQRTTILVSHRLGIARLADRIVVMEGGRIVEQGTHDELLAQAGSQYAAMWNAQAGWYQ